jgi:hypothetical protein
VRRGTYAWVYVDGLDKFTNKPILGSRVVWPPHLRDPLWEIMRMRHFRDQPGESEIVREWVMT